MRGLRDTSPAEWRERQNQGRRGEDRGGDCVGLPEAEPVGRQASDRRDDQVMATVDLQLPC
jgi:hypothetical protein